MDSVTYKLFTLYNQLNTDTPKIDLTFVSSTKNQNNLGTLYTSNKYFSLHSYLGPFTVLF